MRRGGMFLATTTAMALALAALAGCGGKPPGVDGDLTNHWPAFAAPTLDTPVAGQCHDEAHTFEWPGPYDSVPCTQSHRIETIAVDTFPDSLAGKPAHPAEGSADLVPLYQSCSSKAATFLGGEWQTGYVSVQLAVPTDNAWKAGARWYACDVLAVSRDIDATYVESTGTAKGGLSGSAPLARTCEIVTDAADHSGITGATAIDCAQPHNAEFAGLYTLSDSRYPADDDTRVRESNSGCEKIFGAFVGIPYGTSDYLGFYEFEITKDEWDLGIRTETCFMVGYDKNEGVTDRFTGSVHGLRGGKPTGWTE